MRFRPRLFSLLPVPAIFALVLASAEPSVTDDLGRVVTLAVTPRRIVSLAPSITETLFAIGSASEVVGVTDFCNFPPEARTKNRVGGITNPSIENIISLKPDLIILSMEGNVREDFNKLLAIGVPVFVTNPRTLAGIYKSIADLGTITGRTHEALLLVRAMQQREDSIRAFVKSNRTVLLIVSLQPLIVVGNKTFLAELLDLVGGVNIAKTSLSTYPTLSREAIVDANPEIIIVMSDVLTQTNDLQKLFPEWTTLRALLAHRVFRISSDIVSRPGPRAVDGLIQLYRIIQEGHE